MRAATVEDSSLAGRVEDGHHLRTGWELLGHRDPPPTLVYTPVINRNGRGATRLGDRFLATGRLLPGTGSASGRDLLRPNSAPGLHGSGTLPREIEGLQTSTTPVPAGTRPQLPRRERR